MSSPRVFRAVLAGAAALGFVLVGSLASCNFDADYQDCLTSGHCTTDGAVTPDGSVQDAGSDAGGPGRDGGVTDAGGQDAGTNDAGGMDAGTQDSGTQDSGTPDSGMDAGVDAGCATTLNMACSSGAQCCPAQMCSQNTNTCCWPTGVACVNNGDCCSGTCHNGTKVCN